MKNKIFYFALAQLILGSYKNSVAQSVAEGIDLMNERYIKMMNEPEIYAHVYLHSYHPVSNPDGPTLGILGDSVAIGSVAFPGLKAHLGPFVSQSVRYIIRSLVLWPSNVNPTHSSPVVDYPLLSFGAIVGSELGSGQKQIINVGQDGVKIKKMAPQIDDLVNVFASRFKKKALPRIILASFNANDMCSNDVLREDVAVLKNNYREQLRKGYEKLSSYQPENEKTDFYMIENLDVLKVLLNKDVLNKQITFSNHAFFEKVTYCRFLREPYLSDEQNGDPELSQWIMKSLIGMCPAILGTDLTDINRINKLRQIYISYLEAQSEISEEFSERLSQQGIYLHVIKETSHIAFTDQDVANDCFHPNLFGHIKIAATILKSDAHFFQTVSSKYSCPMSH